MNEPALRESSVQLGNTGESATNAEDNECVVCFKNVDIFSIGECDHPVCYECSTRMRVLCQQNECPICRQVLSKVIFTNNKLLYRELEAKNRSEYYSKKYKISFNNIDIQQAFFNLLDHPCPKCKVPPYRTFTGLKNHVRKEHDLHYCDLCTDNLNIFTFERRCYTQSELGLHRTKGDADNRSHRGHPLCEYCNKRYLDRDELFRHLRRDHYFCHFCDADGCNEFYKDYDALAEHFRQDHYLCEEGKCASEEFVGAFRTEIDYKAHVASVHGNLLNKHQAKQTRTLQLEITLGPRGNRGASAQQAEQCSTSLRSRGGGSGSGGGGHDVAALYDDLGDGQNLQHFSQQNMQQRITIDACNEADFPSLRGISGGPGLSLTRPPPLSMRNRSGTAGLARTKENFPALGGGGAGETTWVAGQQPLSSQQAPISAMLRKPAVASTGAVPRPTTTTAGSSTAGNTAVIHVSNRPATTQLNKKLVSSSSLDFPALLPTSKSKKRGDLLADTVSFAHVTPLTTLSAKHRSLIDDYVSVANPKNVQKLQTIQKDALEVSTNTDSKQGSEVAYAPQLTAHNFPSLGGSVAVDNTKISGSWFKRPSKFVEEKKQREAESRRLKVALAPQLPNAKDGRTNNNQLHYEPQQSVGNCNKRKGKDKKTEVSSTAAISGNKLNSLNNKAATKENNNNHNHNNENKATKVSFPNGNVAAFNSGREPGVRPPPGFIATNGGVSLKPPPGFQATGSTVTLNSVAKSPNNLTFTNSLGESYSIMTTHAYIPPTEAISRNQRLIGHFKGALQTAEALDEFRNMSQKFREGLYKPQAYYEHCQVALKDQFDRVFPELLALLPDIAKQQALYLVHTQCLKALSAHQRQNLPKLIVCATCKQVLLEGEAENHYKSHEMSAHFPALSGTDTTATSLKAGGKQVAPQHK